MRYPPAPRRSVVDVVHGRLVPDPYRWLEDPANPETQRWQAAQDELWRQHAAALPGRDRLHARVAELSEVGMVGAPVWRGERRFFVRQAAGQEHPVLCTARPGQPEEVVIDPMALDPTGLTTLDHWQPDPDGRLLAYQLSRRGDERSDLCVMDVATRRVIDGPIDRCRYSPVAWLPGGEAFYYVRAAAGQPAHRRRVYLHRVGTPAADDAPIAGQDRGQTVSYGLQVSQDGRWLTISASHGAGGNDVWLADLAGCAPEAPLLRAVQEGVDALTVPTIGPDGRMYVATTRGAPRGRLCVGDPANPGADGWRELVGEDSGAVLDGFTILGGRALARPVLLVGRTRHAIGEIGVHDLATGERLHDVPLPGAGSIGVGSVGPLCIRPSGGHEVWFSYTDCVTPRGVYRYDARTGQTTLWEAAPGAAALPDVVSSRVTCTSADGTPVRMTVLARRPADAAEAAEAGPRPAILYGYGGFGISLTPSYSGYILAWVEAGGTFVTVNLRGGGEEGEDWHRAGMLERKQNVFDDFIAAAERLIADGWTTAGQLGACGESNGGLVVGAALSQRPELFAAAVCSAPLLDMVRFDRFGLGPTWRGEYGSADDPEQLGWLLAYSPYHRVSAGTRYPAVLFTVFGGDTRVDPLHARKMCAALQHATVGDRPILLRTEVDVGHGARAAGRAVALAADLLAFLAAHTGLDCHAQIQPAS